MRPLLRKTAPSRATLAALGVLGAALGGTLEACGGAASRPAASAGTPRLAGVWDATFVLDAPPLGFDTAALRARPDARVRGTLVLVPNHWLTAAAVAGVGLPTAPTLYGTYDLDFTPFGFDPRDAHRVPGVVATATPSGPTGADSVTLVLDPSADREQVTLAGVLRADSVVGTWRVQGPGRSGMTGGGHFVLVAPPATAPPAATPRATLGARARGILLRGGPTAGAER